MKRTAMARAMACKGSVTSQDGTSIAYERRGGGPAVILVTEAKVLERFFAP